MELDLKKLMAEYERGSSPDFVTHLNYLNLFNRLSSGIRFNSTSQIQKRIGESRFLNKKLTLVKLTRKSLEGEYASILSNPDYAEICVSWVAVKAYYLIFNLILILDYLVSGQESSFNLTHSKSLEKFKGLIESGEILFNKRVFSANFPCSRIHRFSAKPGANLRIVDVNISERYMQVLKKLVDYKLEEFARTSEIKNFRSKTNRQARDSFLSSNTINIFEFFFWYRIKANYRDLEFLNREISSDQFKSFYENYFEATMSFYNAFKEEINRLSNIRLGKDILS